jgi:hypothetical protein
MNKTSPFFALVMLIGATGQCCGGVTVERLRCEYQNDPLGIDVTKPRLTWIVQSDQRAERQTAYQVLVASSPDLLAENRGDLWDSGRVDSDQTTHVEYAGKPLGTRMRCFWKARAWDNAGQASPWSKPASWTMGLLRPHEVLLESSRVGQRWTGVAVEQAGKLDDGAAAAGRLGRQVDYTQRFAQRTRRHAAQRLP